MFLKYEIQHKLSSSSTWSFLTRNGTSPFSISELQSATDYDFRIRTVDPSGRRSTWYSLLSITYPDTQAPTIPGNLRIETVGPDYFLFWDVSTDDVEVLEYEAQVSTDGINYSALDTVLHDIVFIELTGLISGTTYYYRVRSVDTSNNSSTWATLTFEYADEEAPTAPTNLAASAIAYSTLTLAWDPSTDNVAVTEYEVQQRLASGVNGDYVTIGTILAPTATLSVTDLTGGTEYRFRVRALDAAENSSSWAPSDDGLLVETVLEYEYLPFDGVNDYAFAINGATSSDSAGTSGEYTFVMKLNSANYTTNRRAGGITDTTGSPSNTDLGALAAFIYQSSTNRQAVQSFTRAGANEGARAYTFADASPCVVAHAYRNGTFNSQGFFARAGVTLDSGNISGTPTVTRVPQHVTIGTTLLSTMTPQSSYSNIQFISCVILNRYPTPSEMADYSNETDARKIWGAAIHSYWVASDSSGTTIAPRSGSESMAIVGGLTSASKVAI
jgi:chitodextrinase